MATAIEYGLVSALIAVAGVAATTALADKPVARNSFCSVQSYGVEPGVAKLDCDHPGYSGSYIQYLEDADVVLKNVARPGGVRLTCDLYKTRQADCEILEDSKKT